MLCMHEHSGQILGSVYIQVIPVSQKFRLQSANMVISGNQLWLLQPAIESFCLKGRANQKKVGQSFDVYILMMKRKTIIFRVK